jgi:large subunit ribosomal protein L6
MSRIGKNPIALPKGVDIKVEKGLVTVKGPKGTLTQDIDPDMIVTIDEESIVVSRPTEQKDHKAKH